MKDQQPPTRPPNDPPPPDDPVELPGDAFFDAGFDTRFEALMRDAARTYNRPPALPDAEALWAAIDRALPAAGEQPAEFDVAHLVTHGTPALGERPALAVLRDEVPPAEASSAPASPAAGRAMRRAAALWQAPLWKSPWLRTAAVLLLGVAIGRATVRRDARPGSLADPLRGATTMTAARLPDGAPLGTEAAFSALPDGITSEYLGRAEALLAALPDELRARRTDPAYLSRADALLLQTRLLLDSPAAADPALRSLFDDLEVVFAQVVRLHADRDPTRIDFLNQALEQRDVLPRLRDAVADNAVADNAAN